MDFRELKRPGRSNTDIYSSAFRHDIDNDSSTDEELSDRDASSDEDDDFKSKFGKIATQTSQQGKVRIHHQPREDDEDEEEEEMEGDVEEDTQDPFEEEMKRELEQRMLQAEKDASIASTCFPAVEQAAAGSGTSASGDTARDKKPQVEKSESDKYDDIYFDSDEEDGEQRKVKTNEELFYDPNMDDEDQNWVDDVGRSYQVTSNKKAKDGKIKPLPSSAAVLNCPACFTVVCLDCQRHEIYKTQYRAMFVMNCSVVTDQKLRVPLKLKGKGKNRKKPITDPNEEFHPVRCDQCKTEIAMYDQDEVYHFFNVVASHT